MKYFLVKQKDQEIFNALINDRLAKGWEPYGSPSVVGVLMIQALIKRPTKPDFESLEHSPDTKSLDSGLTCRDSDKNPEPQTSKKKPKKPFPKGGNNAKI